MKRLVIIFLYTLMIGTGYAYAAEESSFSPGMHIRSYIPSGDRHQNVRYLLYLPEGYGTVEKRWPLILYLHGASVRGKNLAKVRRYGIPWIAQNRRNFPFIAISPQCPSGTRWVDLDAGCIMGLVDGLIDSLAVDTDRVYVTGVSMGGHGAWYLASKYPERFAAVAPLCGRADPKWAQSLLSVPAWVFHGSKDRVCPIRYSDDMVEALTAGGGNVRYTVYPGGGHDIVTRTYGNESLYDWLLSHKKNDIAPDDAVPGGH